MDDGLEARQPENVTMSVLHILPRPPPPGTIWSVWSCGRRTSTAWPTWPRCCSSSTACRLCWCSSAMCGSSSVWNDAGDTLLFRSIWCRLGANKIYSVPGHLGLPVSVSTAAAFDSHWGWDFCLSMYSLYTLEVTKYKSVQVSISFAFYICKQIAGLSASYVGETYTFCSK